MKYIKIIVEIEEGTGVVMPVIFSNNLVHKDMAEVCKKLAKKCWPKSKSIEVVSAGELKLGFDFKVGGKSTSLDLESSPEDRLQLLMNDSMSIISTEKW
jgi:hypothetical protein